MKLVLLGCALLAGAATALPQIVFRQSAADKQPCYFESDGQAIRSACALRPKQLLVGDADVGADLKVLQADLKATKSELALLAARFDALETKHTADLATLQQQHADDVKELEATKDEVWKVDGGFSPWSAWSECSKECDGGTRTRTRTCTSPSPVRNGAPCKGEDGQNYVKSAETQTGTCNTDACEAEGTVTCDFTVDNHVQAVYLDGKDVGSQVTGGSWNNWPSKKTLKFSSLSRTLAIRCDDAEQGCHNGGLAIRCRVSGASGPGQRWAVSSGERSRFSVASSRSWDTPPNDSSGRPWYAKDYKEGSRFGTPRSGYTSYADGVIGVPDMCAPTKDSDRNNKMWFRFTVA